MSDPRRMDELAKNLAAYGSDLSRWPAGQAEGAREALLGDQEFRRAWEAERQLDSALAGFRQTLDREVIEAGATDRLRRRLLAQLPAQAMATFGWQRMAAAVLVACALGGAMDLLLPQPENLSSDLVMLDPLYVLDETEFR